MQAQAAAAGAPGSVPLSSLPPLPPLPPGMPPGLSEEELRLLSRCVWWWLGGDS